MDTVVLDVLAVQATLVPEVLLKLLVDVVGDRLPAKAETRGGRSASEPFQPNDGFFSTFSRALFGFNGYHSVLFTASPNPGVSTMVSLSLTPFSSMSTVCLVISTVCVIRSASRTNSGVCVGASHLNNTERGRGRGGLTFGVEQLPIFVQICEEETVDQGGLSQAGLPFRERNRRSEKRARGRVPKGPTCANEQTASTCDHEREVETLLDRLPVHLVWQRGKTHVFFVLVLQKRERERKRNVKQDTFEGGFPNVVARNQKHSNAALPRRRSP